MSSSSRLAAFSRLAIGWFLLSGGVCDPVAVEAEGDAAGQAHGGDRSMLDRGGVEDDEVAAAFAGSPGDGEEVAVAFRGARGAGDEDGFGDRVAGGQGEG